MCRPAACLVVAFFALAMHAIGLVPPGMGETRRGAR
jgi:hypothetical protein